MGTPSPLQNASATAFGAAAYAPAFGSAGMGPSAPTIYANSSGPLSPQHSQVPRLAAAQHVFLLECLVLMLLRIQSLACSNFADSILAAYP